MSEIEKVGAQGVRDREEFQDAGIWCGSTAQ